MVVNLMGKIAKFFSDGKSGAKVLQEAYNRFGTKAVNEYFDKRTLTEKFNFDLLKSKLKTKPVRPKKELNELKDGGMVKKKKTSSSSSGSVKRRNGIAIKGTKFKGIF